MRFALLLLFFVAMSPAARAGFFSTARLLQTDEYAVGVEPEAVLSNDQGLGVNLRLQYGLDEDTSAYNIVGAGSGERKFRLGGGVYREFFADTGRQPAIGMGFQAIFYRYQKSQVDLTVFPMISKRFFNDAGDSVQPFLGVHFGPGVRAKEYNLLGQLGVGGIYQRANQKLAFVSEIDLNLAHAEDVFSIGIVYYIDPARKEKITGENIK